MIWKSIVKSFNIIDYCLAWRIGAHSHVHIGVDPWFGCSDHDILPPHLVVFLTSYGIKFLNQIVNVEHSSLMGEHWLTMRELNILD